MTHKVLLADDSVTIRKVVELTFSDEDFQITAVGDGARAMERARAERPDIVISDVGMPGLDGYALCEAMKADAGLRTVPFLLLRGTFESFDEEKARACGADGVIVKPFEAQELVRKVKELIAGSAAAPVPVSSLPLQPPAPPRAAAAPAPSPRPAAPPPPPRAAAAPPAEPLPSQTPRVVPPGAPPVAAAPPARPVPPPPPPPPPPPAPAIAPGVPSAETAVRRPALPPPPPPPVRPVNVPSPQAGPFAGEDFDLGPVVPEQPAAGGPDDDLWNEVNLRSGSAPIIDPAVGEDNLWGSLADATLLEEQRAPVPSPIERPPVRETVPRAEQAPAPAPAPSVPTPLAAALSASVAPGAPAVPPAGGLGQGEIERLVAARVDAAVRQALEPLVAGLARAVLEDVAWQVVPELAEAMIRAEIERVARGSDSG